MLKNRVRLYLNWWGFGIGTWARYCSRYISSALVLFPGLLRFVRNDELEVGAMTNLEAYNEGAS